MPRSVEKHCLIRQGGVTGVIVQVYGSEQATQAPTYALTCLRARAYADAHACRGAGQLQTGLHAQMCAHTWPRPALVQI